MGFVCFCVTKYSVLERPAWVWVFFAGVPTLFLLQRVLWANSYSVFRVLNKVLSIGGWVLFDRFKNQYRIGRLAV